MRKDIQDRWVNALLSGKYKQTQGWLKAQTDEDDLESVGYCCLGVLCELAVEDGVIESSAESYFGQYKYNDDSDVMPPVKVLQWAGIEPRKTGKYSGEKYVEGESKDDDFMPDKINRLAEANDGGATFKNIASRIKRFKSE